MMPAQPRSDASHAPEQAQEEEPFSVGEVREVVEKPSTPGRIFRMRFTARPRLGGRRAVGRWCRGGSRRDRPLMGSRPRPPLMGGAVTISRSDTS